ncbi:hypothetical protein CLV63_10246 [Murinocardiopsis flavida]|uniref:Uncharacterized protein n=2 Tax=Murinocardiopsis flavida TaxID=645275 RepID=A0A2P8DRT3_9ACTN|nr:hypothetical protein [Murinocardiopsis flavida]PSK99919.1 hypothetical protein CLV63_10246 [Murinocardiopsis flavida]
MRTAAKIAATAAIAATLFGLGQGSASATDDEAFQACVNEQGGLINLDLDLLSQCLANNNG